MSNEGTIYQIKKTSTDEKIHDLELIRQRIEEDLEDAMQEYARASKRGCFKKKKPWRKPDPILLDGVDFE
jgi:hypothetical protein